MDRFAYWRADLARPGVLSRDTSDDIDGWWRMEGARTKPDWPVVVWHDVDGICWLKIGRKNPVLMSSTEGEDWRGAGWNWCKACTETEHAIAIDTGRWPDGKNSRQLAEEEKVDIIPDGGNSADGGPSYDEQINAKMQLQLKRYDEIGKVDSEDKARKAAEVLEAIRALGKLGNARREADRAPHLAAAQAVQNIWLPILTPGSELVPKIVKAIDDFVKAEKARLQAIADEEARVERERLQKIRDEEARIERERLQQIADEQAREENERRRREYEAAGSPTPPDEVVAEQVVVEAEEVVVEAKQVEAPKVATQFGRAVSKAKVTKGRITDRSKFIRALAGQADFEEWLVDKANKLARAKVEIAGMEIFTE